MHKNRSGYAPLKFSYANTLVDPVARPFSFSRALDDVSLTGQFSRECTPVVIYIHERGSHVTRMKEIEPDLSIFGRMAISSCFPIGGLFEPTRLQRNPIALNNSIFAEIRSYPHLSHPRVLFLDRNGCHFDS